MLKFPLANSSPWKQYALDDMFHAAIDAGVKRAVCLSTDKVVYPINAMGISKAMMDI